MYLDTCHHETVTAQQTQQQYHPHHVSHTCPESHERNLKNFLGPLLV